MQVSTQPFLSTAECVSKSLSIFGSLSVLLKWDNTYSAQGQCEASIKCLWKSSWYKYKGSGFSDLFQKTPLFDGFLASVWLSPGLFICLPVINSSFCLPVYASMYIYHFICQLSISHSFYCLIGMSMWVYKWISSYPLFRIFEHLSAFQVFCKCS